MAGEGGASEESSCTARRTASAGLWARIERAQAGNSRLARERAGGGVGTCAGDEKRRATTPLALPNGADDDACHGDNHGCWRECSIGPGHYSSGGAVRWAV